MKFKCWDKEDTDRVVEVESSFASSAAELCADKLWDPTYRNDMFEIEVQRLPEDDQTFEVESFTVDVELEPVFSAYRNRRSKPKVPEATP
jgi:hypothetical protein